MEFIQANILNIIIVILFIVTILFLIKKNKTKEVKEILFLLVLKAEEIYGSGTGEIKYASVVEKIYKKLPSLLLLLFSEKEIDSMIEEAVLRMKKRLEEEENGDL